MKKYLISQIIILLIISLLSCSLPTDAIDNNFGSSNYSFLTSEENDVIKLVNRERAKEGLKSLTSFKPLADAADIRAKEIYALFSHTRPNGKTPDSVLSETSVPSFRAFGENIAKGQKNAESVVNAWMNSSGHKANIMSSRYSDIAVGFYEENGVKCWVQLFYTKW